VFSAPWFAFCVCALVSFPLVVVSKSSRRPAALFLLSFPPYFRRYSVRTLPRFPLKMLPFIIRPFVFLRLISTHGGSPRAFERCRRRDHQLLFRSAMTSVSAASPALTCALNPFTPRCGFFFRIFPLVKLFFFTRSFP